MSNITKYKHEIMWWLSRLTVMLTSLFLSFTLAAQAYAAEIQMGSNGNLVFDPAELNIAAGDTVTIVNGDLPPHNFVVTDHPELSPTALAFVGGATFDITFDTPGRYEFQCEPHAGAGMKGVINVQ